MEPILIDTATLMKKLSVSRNTAVKIGDMAGARFQIGRIVRWRVEDIERYLTKSKEDK